MDTFKEALDAAELTVTKSSSPLELYAECERLNELLVRLLESFEPEYGDYVIDLPRDVTLREVHEECKRLSNVAQKYFMETKVGECVRIQACACFAAEMTQKDILVKKVRELEIARVQNMQYMEEAFVQNTALKQSNDILRAENELLGSSDAVEPSAETMKTWNGLASSPVVITVRDAAESSADVMTARDDCSTPEGEDLAAKYNISQVENAVMHDFIRDMVGYMGVVEEFISNTPAQLDAVCSTIVQIEACMKTKASSIGESTTVVDNDLEEQWAVLSVTNAVYAEELGKMCHNVAMVDTVISGITALVENVESRLPELAGLVHDRIEAFERSTGQFGVLNTLLEETRGELDRLQSRCVTMAAVSTDFSRVMDKIREKDVSKFDQLYGNIYYMVNEWLHSLGQEYVTHVEFHNTVYPLILLNPRDFEKELSDQTENGRIFIAHFKPNQTIQGYKLAFKDTFLDPKTNREAFFEVFCKHFLWTSYSVSRELRKAIRDAGTECPDPA